MCFIQQKVKLTGKRKTERGKHEGIKKEVKVLSSSDKGSSTGERQRSMGNRPVWGGSSTRKKVRPGRRNKKGCVLSPERKRTPDAGRSVSRTEKDTKEGRGGGEKLRGLTKTPLGSGGVQ